MQNSEVVRPFEHLAYVEVMHSFHGIEGFRQQLTSLLPGSKNYGICIKEADCRQVPSSACYYMLVWSPTRVEWDNLSNREPSLGGTAIDNKWCHKPMVAYILLAEEDNLGEWVLKQLKMMNAIAGDGEKFGNVSLFEQWQKVGTEIVKAKDC